MCVCVCVCVCVYMSQDHLESTPFGVRTFWESEDFFKEAVGKY